MESYTRMGMEAADVDEGKGSMEGVQCRADQTRVVHDNFVYIRLRS